MAKLNPADTAAMLDFVYELPDGYLNFPQHVLQLISKYFSHHILTFIPINTRNIAFRKLQMDSWLNDYVSLNLSDASMRNYNLHCFEDDIFRYKNLPQRLKNKTVVYIEDIMPYEQYCQLEYARQLMKFNLAYQAVIHLNYQDTKLGVISVYHTPEEGNFTEDDFALFETLARFITQHYAIAIGNSQRYMASTMFEACYDRLDLGVVMINDKLQVIKANSAAEMFADAILGSGAGAKVKKGIDAAGRYPHIQQVIRDIGSPIFLKKTEPATLSADGNLFEFYSSSFVSPNKNLSKIESLYIVFIFRNSKADLFSGANQQLLAVLTNREAEIVRLISKGYTNAQISEEIYISVHTVKTHILNIYKKLHVGNRTSLLHKLASE
ncbi:MAG: hypothetical protein GXY32_04660 [Ruminococcaceae bacterium]|nr:hypothetical protein [Oscillospiraceae bacterium]